jgi:6-pyruvoyltetrahydropterin/6-carboxytetrahydropterin synthase
MVVDFGDINRVIKTWIDMELDHKMLLCKDDPLLKILQDLNEPCFVMDSNPTAENIAKLIYDYALSQGFEVSTVRLWETVNSFATYSCAPLNHDTALKDSASSCRGGGGV